MVSLAILESSLIDSTQTVIFNDPITIYRAERK